mmetsp:Transcript_53573/g.116797  ORF Transcript_53573/g.116797 Transcript_53573/m.116797 type:complete len:223 (+) Transcript_53573:100-768(+)
MPDVIRVLCLHGFAQNAAMFRARTGSLRKVMKGCEFTFLDAPHLASASFLAEAGSTSPTDSTACERGSPLAWWNSIEENVRPSQSRSYTGLEASLGQIQHAVTTDGPFDCILGFSQGATLAALYCLLSASPPPFRALLLIAGFMPRDTHVLSQLANKPPGILTMPSVHVTGSSDAFVPSSSTMQLSEFFLDAEVVHHPGGHGIPTGTEFRAVIKRFVNLILR